MFSLVFLPAALCLWAKKRIIILIHGLPEQHFAELFHTLQPSPSPNDPTNDGVTLKLRERQEGETNERHTVKSISHFIRKTAVQRGIVEVFLWNKSNRSQKLMALLKSRVTTLSSPDVCSW